MTFDTSLLALLYGIAEFPEFFLYRLKYLLYRLPASRSERLAVLGGKGPESILHPLGIPLPLLFQFLPGFKLAFKCSLLPGQGSDPGCQLVFLVFIPPD